MSFSPSSRSEEFNSSPPLVGAFLPLASPDQDPPRDEASHGRTAPPSRHSANDNIMDTIDTKDAKAKTNSELPSSQSGLPVPVSSYAHTKGPMGPPEMRAALPSELNSQSAAVPQFEFDSQPNDHDQLHASRPSTPEEQPELEAEPDKPIEAFDWHDLEMRYHDMIRERDAAEQQLLQEFDHLSQFFCQWAEAGALRETDRSYKRLKTQMTYVNQEEQQLEAKRQHYVQVVNAFRSALDLLNGP